MHQTTVTCRLNKHIRPKIPHAVTRGAVISELETIESHRYQNSFSLLVRMAHIRVKSWG